MDHRSNDLPEGVINADPPGGWDENADEEAREQDAAATASPDLVGTSPEKEAGLLTDAALQPDDPVEGEAARQGADPELTPDAGRGEEP